MQSHLNEFLIFLLAVIVSVPIFKFFKMGAILAYLFAGIILGPDVLGLIKDPKTILHLSEFGVVILLFIIGLELKPSRLWAMKYWVFGMGTLQVAITGFLFFIIGYTSGFSLQTSFIAGFGLALSSTAFCLQILEEQRQMKTTHGQGAFSILLLQDLAVVPLIALVPVLAGTSTSKPALEYVITIVGIIAFILVGTYLTRSIFRVLVQTRVQEVFTAVSLFIVIGSAVLFEKLGLSMGMGAFLAGVVLANSEYRHELETNLLPFKGLLLGLFFIAVGMALDLKIILQKPWVLISIVLCLIVIKILVVYLLGRLFRFTSEASRSMALLLPQGGEFAFVLFSSALALGLLNTEQNSLLSAAVTISMLLTPVLYSLNQKFFRSYSYVSEKPIEDFSHLSSKVIVAGHGRYGQIVSRFLRSQGVSFTILDIDAKQIDTARLYGERVYYGDAAKKEILEAAGAKDAEVLVLTLGDMDVSLEAAKIVKHHFPHLKILARARNRQHHLQFLDLGVDLVQRESYHSSLETAVEVMNSLGWEEGKVRQKIALFKKHDRDILAKQFLLREDEKSFISFTTAANRELEQILKEEFEEQKS